jgi:hypothetical protein
MQRALAAGDLGLAHAALHERVCSRDGRTGLHGHALPGGLFDWSGHGLAEYTLAHSLLRWQTALHEWLGLWAYVLTR